MLTQQELQELFDYSDGNLCWKKYRSGRATAGAVAGSQHRSGYIEIGISGTLYQAHRLIYLWHHGTLPAEIDHKNRIRSDNRIENLRALCRSDNMANSESINSVTGYRGVTKRKGYDRYRARISKNNTLIELGDYPTPEEASEAYKNARREYFPNVFLL